MKDKIETGGPAFPHSRLGSDADGMTLRDYFAAQVLPTVYQTLMEDALRGESVFYDENWRVDLARNVYKMADAMLEARKK